MTTKPDPPKRPMNATFLYLNEHRAAYAKEHPELKLTEVTSKLSDQYKTLSEKEKDKYIKQYAKAKTEYEKVLACYFRKRKLMKISMERSPSRESPNPRAKKILPLTRSPKPRSLPARAPTRRAERQTRRPPKAKTRSQQARARIKSKLVRAKTRRKANKAPP